MTRLLALAVAALLGLFLPVPHPLPSLGLLLAALTVLAAPGRTGCLSLGLRCDWTPQTGGEP